MAETPYVETEALLAVMRDNADEAREILHEMLPGELHMLAGHAYELHQLARSVIIART